jgi:intermediate filament protein if
MATTSKNEYAKEPLSSDDRKDRTDGRKEPDGPVYRPLVSPRTTIINRTSAAPPNKPSAGANRNPSYSSHVPAGAYAKLTQTGVTNVKNDRQKEKKDMQDLNERLGSYIEKSRFLESQNRKLADELDKLKQTWGKETGAIKAMYEAELDEARKLLNEAEKEKARLEIRNSSLEEQVEELRKK